LLRIDLREDGGVSRVALYGKLNGLEPGTSRASAERGTSKKLLQVILYMILNKFTVPYFEA